MTRFPHRLSRIAPYALIFIILNVTAVNIKAKKTRMQFSHKAATTKNLEIEGEIVEFSPTDSVTGIKIMGYDKPLTAIRESMLVSNERTGKLKWLKLEIEYLDMNGSQLHKRLVEIPVTVPSGETRLVEIKTFDRNNAYYYHKSRKPRSDAEPYKIKVRVVAIREM